MKKLVCMLLALMLAIASAAALAEDAAWSCPSCATQNSGNFCIECGTPRPQEITCPGCGAAYPMDTPYRFCASCGSPLKAEADEPAAQEASVEGPSDEAASGFATPEEAALRYVEGLKERDLDKMLSAFDWEALEAHRTLANVLRQNKGYNAGATTPSLPGDGGMLSALNIIQQKAQTANLIRMSMLHFLATGPLEKGSLAEAVNSVGTFFHIDEASVDGFIAQFDVARMESLGRIENVQVTDPETVLGQPVPESALKSREVARVMYGADEMKDLAITFEIDGSRFACFPGFARYGDRWTMYVLVGTSGALFGIGVQNAAFVEIQ